MESARAWRYRHWASGGAYSLSPLLSDTPPIGLVRFQSPSQTRVRVKPGQGIEENARSRFVRRVPLPWRILSPLS